MCGVSAQLCNFPWEVLKEDLVFGEISSNLQLPLLRLLELSYGVVGYFKKNVFLFN